jgi:hypothetical protein
MKNATQDLTSTDWPIRDTSRPRYRRVLINPLMWACPIVEIDILNQDTNQDAAEMALPEHDNGV